MSLLGDLTKKIVPKGNSLGKQKICVPVVTDRVYPSEDGSIQI